jgi:uncharacterized RDD family membrane protein YckC
MAQTYILVIEGKPQGPFSIDELKSLKIKPEDFVKTPEMDDYKEAHDMEELRGIFGFAKPDLLMQYFAGFDQRLLASALDWFMLYGIFIVITFITVLFIPEKETRIIVATAILSTVPLINVIYRVSMESSARQATLGKQILKIKVTDMRGRRITAWRAFGRNWCKVFSALTFCIGYILPFFNKKRQCLHDMMANTLVIQDRLF